VPRRDPARRASRGSRAGLSDAVRRGADVVVAVLVLTIGLPVLVVVAAAVALSLGRPVLYAQERAGRGGRAFRLLKFRSMLPVDVSRGLVDDADRLTPFGRWLRASSLDELPGLVNVLRGELGLVGPRPLPVDYLARYSAEQARRHDVRPGMTGLAQVSGRNELSWEERLRLDVAYVDQRCLAVDLRILLRTVAVVLRRDGVTRDGHATCPEFLGEVATRA